MNRKRTRRTRRTRKPRQTETTRVTIARTDTLDAPTRAKFNAAGLSDEILSACSTVILFE